MSKLYKLALIVYTLFLCMHTNAQVRPLGLCGADELREEMFRINPELKAIYDAKVSEFRAKRANGELTSRVQSEIIEIPIVVHVLDPGISNVVPTDTQIINWVNRANAVFSGEANDILGPNEGGTMLPLRLVLAKRTPQCTTTNGIIRYNLSEDPVYVASGISNGGVGIPYTTINNTYNWDKQSYFNIYVTHRINGRNESSGGSFTAGFATYPGFSTDLSVMLSYVVRDVNDTTFAHEMMHAFGVAHVFEGGDGNGVNCGSQINDGIADTQNTKSLLGVWPVPTNNDFNVCASANYNGVQHNMMNYGYTLNRFTPGQGQYAMDVIYEMRPGLLLSKGGEPIDGTSNNSPIATTCGPIGLTYQGNYNIGIGKFSFGSINSVSSTPTNGNNVYTDYTLLNCLSHAYSTDLVVGETYPITVGVNSANSVIYAIYIDFNNNGSFETSERLNFNIQLPSTDNWNYKSVTVNYTIPNNVLKNVPLRLRLIGDLGNLNLPCDSRMYGEVEDYTVIFKDPEISDDTTIWNGTSWSNGNPTLSKHAIVRGVLEQHTDLEAKTLKIDAGSLTLQDGVTLKVENSITNLLTSDKFIVKDGANIVQINDTDNDGLATVYKKSTPMVFNDATLWASPVENQNVRNYSPQTLLKRFYEYNEATNGFAGLFVYDANYPPISTLKDPLTYNFSPGKGYHIRVSNTHTTNEPGAIFHGTFVGKLNNGPVIVPITNLGRGYNLIGNPYPSNINAELFLLRNPTVSSLHFWTHEAALGTDGYRHNNYASYNLAGGVKAVAGGQTPNKFIQKAQGFIVEANQDGNVTFSNDIRENHNNGIFFRTESESKRLWLDLIEENQPKNQILIAYVEGATNDFDYQMDAKINSTFDGSIVYSLIDHHQQKFVIQGRALPFQTSDYIKLGFKSKKEGSFTLQLNHSENFAEVDGIYLKDNYEGIYTNLKETDYTYTSTVGEFVNRFEIYFSDELLSNHELSQNNLLVYQSNDDIKLQSTQIISKIDVMDALGRLSHTFIPKTNRFIIPAHKGQKEFHILRIVLADETVITRKVIF